MESSFDLVEDETIRGARMFLIRMRPETVTIAAPHGLDWKALGYLISIVSVFFLGAVAWPKEYSPAWYHPVLAVGMATSIIGMGCRYIAHLQEKREIKNAQQEADRR
jgi:hypothetical protein